MEFIKKNYWILLLVVAFAGGFLIRWAMQPPDVRDDLARIEHERELLVKKHHKDSVVYQKTADSLVVVIDRLKSMADIKAAEIVRLRAQNQIKREEIKKLPPIEAVMYFSDMTGVQSSLMSDSMVHVTLPAITIANTLFFERQSFEAENMALSSRSAVQDSVIDNQSKLLGIKDIRITNLTNDYYNSQRVMGDQAEVIKKLKRKVRTKNALVGILTGVGAGLVVYSIVK